MKNVLLTTVASFAFAGAALAGSPAPMAPVTPVVAPAAASTGADWGGFYAGGLVSFDSGNLGYANPAGTAPFASYTYIPSTSYGGFAGYNIQHGNLVFGAEAAYNSGGVAYPGFPSEATTYAADLKGRVGFAAGNALIYGVLGYSFTGWKTLASYTASGLSYGAGIDYMIGDHLFVGAEYLARDMRGLRGGTGPIEGHSQLQSGELRVGWRF